MNHIANARHAHNPKVEGSNPSPATKFFKKLRLLGPAISQLLTNLRNPKITPIRIVATIGAEVLSRSHFVRRVG
jgi:hypothetical protein